MKEAGSGINSSAVRKADWRMFAAAFPSTKTGLNQADNAATQDIRWHLGDVPNATVASIEWPGQYDCPGRLGETRLQVKRSSSPLGKSQSLHIINVADHHLRLDSRGAIRQG